MLFPSSSQSAALVALLLAAVSPADATTPSKSACVRSRGTELAELASCGHQGSLRYCFGALPEFFTQSDLETCFVNAGCTADESAIEALWTLRRCENPESLADLRKRQNRPVTQNDPLDPEEETTTQARQQTTQQQQRPTTQQQQQQTTTQARQQQTTQAAQRTTTAAAAETTEQTSDEVVVITQTVGTTEAQNTLTSTPLTCIITTTVDTTLCPIQTTGPRAGKETLPCFPTQVSFPTCSPGLFCSTDSQGNPTCMKFNNSLDTGGIIVALFFAVVITSAIGWLTYMCCRDKAQQKKLAAKAEAAAIAAAAKKRPTVNVRSVSGHSDRQPLMEQGPPQGYGPVEVEYPPQQQQYQQQDPFHDRHRM